MNVTRPGSCLRLRTMFAARPTATRSRERSSSTASASSMRSPSAAFSSASSNCCSLGLHEAQLRDGLEQTAVARELEERVQAGAFARPEAVAELLEVAREEACGIAVTLRRLEGELLRLGARPAHGGDERVLELRKPVGERLGARPHGEHHRQAGALHPQPAEIVVRRRVLERRLERGVADEERRVRLFAERDMLRLREQHPRQGDRGGRLRGDRDDAHLLERLARDELDRIDRAFRRDAQPRQQPQLVRVARVLDRRDRRSVELAVEQHLVQLRRHALHLVDLGVDAVEDRRHVHVRDAAELHHRRNSLYSVSRCTGTRPASRIKRTSSSTFCSVPLVAPAAWKICSRTTVPCTSLAPKWRATCAICRPIMIQYAFTFGMLSRINLETAIIFRSSAPVVNLNPRRSNTVFSGWNASGMNARKPPVRSCCSRSRSRWSTRSSYVSTCPYSIVQWVGMPSRCAVSCVWNQ